MPKVNTRDRIMQAALKLFVEQGYQKTSIARIETEAGLAPRAGAFYRHFESKQALLVEIARSYVSRRRRGSASQGWRIMEIRERNSSRSL
jgi:AcrR family transcriptional regulator